MTDHNNDAEKEVQAIQQEMNAEKPIRKFPPRKKGKAVVLKKCICNAIVSTDGMEVHRVTNTHYERMSELQEARDDKLDFVYNWCKNPVVKVNKDLNL